MTSDTILNWLEGRHDTYTRPQAVALQSSVHRNLLDAFADADAMSVFMRSDRTHWRHQAIVKSQLVTKKAFSGCVLEIGAGSGWLSSVLSMAPQVEKVYCTDYDPFAVESLMPQVQKVIGAQAAKIQRALASFNSLPLENEIDLVVSIGALHHSENLYVTLNESFKALKPGGWLVASEPTYPDNESNQKLLARYKKEDPASMKKYGRTTRHEDNSDHYYRISEFITAAYGAKFDVYPFVFDLAGNRQADDNTLSDRKTATGFFPNILYPYFAKTAANPLFDNLLLILQKPADGGAELNHVLSGQGQAW